MENDRTVPLSEFLVDELAKEAVEAGFTGRGVDGYVSSAVEQRGQEALRKITEQFTVRPVPTENPQQNSSPSRSS